MANIMIWVTIMLTIPVGCLSQAVASVPLTHDLVTASCSGTTSTVTLNLTGVSPRPTTVIINGYTNDSLCTVNITGSSDTETITVDLGECGISGPLEEYTLHIMQNAVYGFIGDLFVHITCTGANVAMVEANVVFSEVTPFTKAAEGTAAPSSTEVSMVILPKSAVTLGDSINLTITTDGTVTFELIGCSVESTDVNDVLIGPHDITHGWCSDEATLLTNFTNTNSPSITSVSTITAFRLAGQGPSKPLTFKCSLKWCPISSLFCDHTATPVCPQITRRRRAIDGNIGQHANERTLTSSIYVNLPGYAPKTDVSGASVITGIDYIVKLAVLLFCGVYSII